MPILAAHIRLSLTDPMTVLSVSDGIEALLGFKPEDFLTGKVSLKNRIHAHDQDIADELFSTEATKASGTFNIRLRQANGRIRCIKGHYTKEPDASGTHLILELHLQDAKSLWQGLGDQPMMANFKAMMENTDDYIYFKDRNHVFNGASQTLVAITAPSEHWTDLLGQTDYDVFPEEYADIYYRLEKQVFAGIPVASEVQETLDNNGNKGWVDNRKYPIKNEQGEIIGLFGIARDITGQKQAEELLRKSESCLRLSQASGGIGTWEADLVSNKQWWSENCIALFGLPALDEPTWEDFLAVIHQEDRQRVIDATQSHIDQGTAYDVEYRIIAVNGNIRWVRSAGQVERDAEGKPSVMRGIGQDITARKQVEADLRIASVALESQESLIITDADGVILRVNQAFTEITGYTAEEAVGQTPRLLKSDRHNADFYLAMWETINRTGTWHGEVWDRRKNGEVYPAWLTITAVKGDGGSVTHYVGSHLDITERKLAEEKINLLAFYDPLTRLPNRRLLFDRLKLALASSARSGRKGALLFIDLDNFKTLNDTLGHNIGDLLLQQVALRLEPCVREGDTVARLGGDEFVVILEDLSEQTNEAAAQTESIGEKIIATLNQPYQLARHEYRSTPSIGATLFNNHQYEIDELFKQADIAMYQAKKAGRNTLRFFDPQMQRNLNERAALEDELRKALDKKQFQLYYQIQVDSLRRPLGAEALLRWAHPERGLLSHDQFISVADETGLILPIGQWVLETACAQLKAWQQDARTRDLVLAVNVSVKQLHQVDFVAQVKTAMQRHAINPRQLNLELTESMLLENIEATIASMTALKATGVRFSLDDFGSGYSSLQYLKRLPLDQLKMPQSFIRNISTDRSDQAIVRTIIAMAQSLGLDAIAEGVETEEQRQLLLGTGCTHFQGYLFGKPAPVEQFEALLK